MRASLSLLRSLSFSLHHHRLPCSLPTFNPHRFSSVPLASSYPSAASHSNFVEHSANEDSSSEEEEWDYGFGGEKGSLMFDLGLAGREMIRHMGAPSLKVKELEELPGEWRRSKLTWLCKELPALVRVQRRFLDIFSILNPTRKWLRQEDATFVVVHFIRIGEYKVAHRVYNWMQGEDWYRFDFALATKLADSMGKQQKWFECRIIFDDIIRRRHMPSESTFHILIDAYLSVPNKYSFDAACCIYNGMIHQGGYQPHLNVHNYLFRALSKLGPSSKRYLKQVELIFHNLVTLGLEIPKEFYVGLIWLHSYQRTADKERIASLREEMRQVGIEEGKEVLLSVLRVHSKEGDVEEAERICFKLLDSNDDIPTQAFVYKMVVYAKIGEFTKSLDTFREMRKLMGSVTVPEYRELIEVLCKVENTKLAESVMDEFVKSGLKPPVIMPSYINITNLNLGMPDRLHLAFFEYENIFVYNIYLESLIKAGNVEKADEVFNQMQSDETIGIDARSCNTILSGYLSSCNTMSSGYLASEKYNKVHELFHLMCKKDYDVEPRLDDDLDYVLRTVRKDLVNLV